MLDGVEIDRPAIGALEQHVVKPDGGAVGSLVRGLAFGVARDLVGALVHDLEAHVLQHRHAFRQRDRPVVAPNLQPDAIAPVAGATVEVDAERHGCATALR